MPKIEPGDMQSGVARNAAAAPDHVEGDRGLPKLDLAVALTWVAVVVSVRDHLAGEDRLADDVNAILPAGDVALELGRTPDHVGEPLGMP